MLTLYSMLKIGFAMAGMIILIKLSKAFRTRPGIWLQIIFCRIKLQLIFDAYVCIDIGKTFISKGW